MSGILPDAMRRNVRWRGTKDGKKIAYRRAKNGNIFAPWSAQDDEIGRIDHGRAKRAGMDGLCGACGKGFSEGDLGTFFTNPFGGPYFDEPPLHVDCAGYTIRACPHLREYSTVVLIAKTWEWQNEAGAHGYLVDDVGLEKISQDEFLKMTRPTSTRKGTR